MWKPEPSDPSSADSISAMPAVHSRSSVSSAPPRPSSLVAAGEVATIGKGIVVQGEISGTDSLVIEGRVEGSIHLDGNRVTVERGGQAAADITAREVVVIGKVRGNVTATGRLDIRAEGGVLGNLSTPRLSIEDGAFFKGAIDVRKVAAKTPPQGIKTAKSGLS